jgi:RNA polymerase sigma factor (TIGR02999 family)
MSEELPGGPMGQPPITAGRDINEANEQLFAKLYADLHRLADRELSRHPGMSVSPTTLVHETYLNVAGREGVSFADRARFLGYIARAMRGLLIDFVRRQKALKRGAGFHITQLTTQVAEKVAASEDLDRLSEALDELAARDPRLAEVVDLKYFCGFSFAEIAGLHGTSERTVQRDWEKARLLLYKQIDAADACSKT